MLHVGPIHQNMVSRLHVAAVDAAIGTSVKSNHNWRRVTSSFFAARIPPALAASRIGATSELCFETMMERLAPQVFFMSLRQTSAVAAALRRRRRVIVNETRHQRASEFMNQPIEKAITSIVSSWIDFHWLAHCFIDQLINLSMNSLINRSIYSFICHVLTMSLRQTSAVQDGIIATFAFWKRR